MSSDSAPKDPLEFMKNLWGQMGFALPGMVAPTLDLNDLEKRIADLKAVEGWLRMNQNMLHLTIQGLEMHRATVAAMHAMRESAHAAATQASSRAEKAEPPPEPPAENETPAFNPAALWPWNLMPKSAPAAEPEAPPPDEPASAKPARPRRGKSAS
ncbi:PhaM family polyhydroxyalkanoate granule multifunctional regulatory protein [Niveibacterium sp. SC-1]|uniref:PhaM family polyhydroxyalkanoate granule multifunctional regulatory protein n=1 Tax=Niveibacterium sp. SC-1 TaxID=3135646 RepID=UPI00311E0780